MEASFGDVMKAAKVNPDGSFFLDAKAVRGVTFWADGCRIDLACGTVTVGRPAEQGKPLGSPRSDVRRVGKGKPGSPGELEKAAGA